ncbi:MAG: hypothetical protein A2542_04095 [Parcubacteria group bacterium RIFOXYD2_FULL_52_8]|nr:MAG: hypothetical protein A2542_04095 [Parcubacteria group bacterium RIFOXYD2_FULL_52_8]
MVAAAASHAAWQLTTDRKLAAVRAAAIAEAQATGLPVAYADTYVGCGGVGVRWRIATPNGTLGTAAQYDCALSVRVCTETTGFSGAAARAAVAAYDRERWLAIWEAA